MWNKQHPESQGESEEKQAVEHLKSLLSRTDRTEKEPGIGYWENLTNRMNRGIDAVSSGKGISISWAARVALPGAIAILFFFIGLHYYVPERGPAQISVSEIVSGMPVASQDSLFTHLLERSELTDSNTAIYENLLDPSEADMEQYLVSMGSSSVLLQLLSEDQVNEILSILRHN